MTTIITACFIAILALIGIVMGAVTLEDWVKSRKKDQVQHRGKQAVS